MLPIAYRVLLFSLASLIWLASIEPSHAAQPEESPTERAVNECSIFGVAKANAMAWRSGDVLLRVTHSFDNVEFVPDGNSTGAVFESVIYCRLMFDYESNRFAWMNIETRNVVDVGNKHIGKPVADKSTFFHGTCIDEASGKILDFQEGGLSKIDRSRFSENTDELLKALPIPDFRGYWVTEGTRGFAAFMETMETFESGKNFYDHKATDDFIEILTKGKMSNATRFQQFKFAPDTMMPVEYSSQLDDINGVKKRVDSETAEFTWLRMNNVFVPRRNKISRMVEIRVNRQPQEGRQYTVADFHWFSFNEPEKLDEKMLGGGCFENMETFLALLDPKKSGATSLLEDEKVDGEHDPENPDG